MSVISPQLRLPYSTERSSCRIKRQADDMNENNFENPQNNGVPDEPRKIKPLRSLSRIHHDAPPADTQPARNASFSDVPYESQSPDITADPYFQPQDTADYNGFPPQRPPVYDDYPQENMPEQPLPPRRHKKKKNKVLMIFRKLLAVIATTILSLSLVMIITGTIVATALTFYVLDFMEASTSITLQELESGSDTYFYSTELDEEGNEKLTVIHRVKTDVQRIPVSIDRIPQHVRDAFVYAEDERFYSHDGVDYKRTFSAFVNMFLHIYDTEQGGSTITQQLIKNLTGDDEHSPQRKIREIFSAMQLEKSYSKDEILEEYLNYIGFGGAFNGIQLASLQYFGKNVEELSTAEAAVLAAIPKSPEEYGPYTEYVNKYGEKVSGRDVNRERQKYVLRKLYENGAITYDEYQEYRNTPIIYADTDEYKALHPETTAQELIDTEKAQTWEVDAIYREFIQFMEDEYDIDEYEAIKRINKGGYKVYTTIDHQMQDYVTEKFLDLNNIVDSGYVTKFVDLDGDGEYEEYKPHVAFVALNYDGTVRATVGQWGEKKDSLVTSYSDHDKRPIGSTIKPIAGYSYAIEHNLVHWGTVLTDTHIFINPENGKPWPYNYDGPPTGNSYQLWYFLQRSINTASAQLVEMGTREAVYKHVTENMGLRLNPDYDVDWSPLSIGQMRYGVTLENLVNAYIPFGNQGIYNEAHIITRIEDSNQRVIYENDGRPRKAISDETAWVMNRMMKNVIEAGTGTAAKLNNKVVVGKTGTTENWWDLTFVGLTRDFVSGITIGYDINSKYLELPHSLSSAQIWKNIIGEYADTMFPDTPRDFDKCNTVIEHAMCSSTGLVAGPNCPLGNIGYWKSDYAPPCNGGHYVAPPKETGGDDGGDAPVDNGGGGDAPVVDNGGGGGDAPVVDNGGGGDAPVVDNGGGGDAPVVDNGGGEDW